MIDISGNPYVQLYMYMVQVTTSFWVLTVGRLVCARWFGFQLSGVLLVKRKKELAHCVRAIKFPVQSMLALILLCYHESSSVGRSFKKKRNKCADFIGFKHLV